jgi:hypothetical protein
MVVFFSRGSTTAMVGVLHGGQGAFPRALPGQLAQTLAQHISGSSQ